MQLACQLARHGSGESTVAGNLRHVSDHAAAEPDAATEAVCGVIIELLKFHELDSPFTNAEREALIKELCLS